MNNCQYCGRPAPYKLGAEEKFIFLCDGCFTSRKDKLKKEGYKLVHTDLRIIK